MYFWLLFWICFGQASGELCWPLKKKVSSNSRNIVFSLGLMIVFVAGRSVEGESEQVDFHKDTASLLLLLCPLLQTRWNSWQCRKLGWDSTRRSHWKLSLWGQMHFTYFSGSCLLFLVWWLEFSYHGIIFQFEMRVPQMCKVVCRLVLNAKTAKEFKEKIDDEYRVNM